mmetsp:Transcript_23673/g.42862  ORF Transcript_23673/g.42862 Transcript_23673/m.42862 type:complete len:228 (+) Transcript_23673:126-809(+)
MTTPFRFISVERSSTMTSGSRSDLLALPVDRQDAAHDCHPDNANCRGHADVEDTEVQGGQQEAEGTALHGGFDGNCTAGPLVKSANLGGEEAKDTTEEVKGHAGELKGQASTKDWASALGHRGAHEEHSGDHTHHGCEGCNCLAESWGQSVETDAGENWCQDNLEGRDDNALGIDRHDGSQDHLADQRCHENGTQGRGRGHKHTECHIASCDESAQVGSLTTVDGAH